MKSYKSCHGGKKEKYRARAGFALVLFVLLGIFGTCALIWPYRHPIILGFILALFCRPLQAFFERKFPKYRSLATTLTTVTLVLLVAIPVFLMTGAIIRQGVIAFNSMQTWMQGEGPAQMEAWFRALPQGVLGEWLDKFLALYPDFDMDNLDIKGKSLALASTGVQFLLHQGKTIAGNIGNVLTLFFMMVLVFFGITHHYQAIMDRLVVYVPLSGSQERQILERAKVLVKSIFVGTFLTAVVQGIAGGIAFFFLGFPGFFWGAVMAFASLIPVVGTALVWVPVVAWLFITGAFAEGIGLLLWCVLVVGSIDNFLRPLFMRGGANMNGVVIFFAILGGIQLFGLLGILYGPLIFGLASVLFYIYQVEFADFLKYQERN